MKNKVKRILFCAALSFSFVLLAYAVNSREVYDALVKAMANKAPQTYIKKLERRFSGKRIGGFAYFRSFTKDSYDRSIITVSTEKDNTKIGSVGMIIILKRYAASHKRLKRGDPVHFSATFKEIRMDSLVLEEGIVTRVRSKKKR